MRQFLIQRIPLERFLFLQASDLCLTHCAQSDRANFGAVCAQAAGGDLAQCCHFSWGGDVSDLSVFENWLEDTKALYYVSAWPIPELL